MKQIAKIEQLNNAPLFTIFTLKSLLKVKKEALYKNLKRWLKKGTLMKLKKGIYTTGYYLQNLDSKIKETYYEYIANSLMPESYLSLEYILQKYGILTESVFAYTSVTLKKTNTYENGLGKYTYSNIAAKLFTGFDLEELNGFTVAKATKAKALFDFLYLRLIRVKNISPDLLRSYRLNLDDLADADIKEFSEYCKRTTQKKYLFLPKMLKELKSDN